MSLDTIRDAASREKKNEITTCELSRKRKLREVYAYTRLLNAAHPPKLHDLNFDAEPDPDEVRFLEANDIAKGLYFRDSTLPSPFQDGKLFGQSIHAPSPKPYAASPQLQPSAQDASPSPVGKNDPNPRTSMVSAQQLPDGEAALHDGTEDLRKISEQGEPAPVPGNLPTKAASNAVAPAFPSPSEPSSSIERPPQPMSEAPAVDPSEVAAPTADDAAHVPGSDISKPPDAASRRPSKVIHLPPKEDQERHLHEIERAQEIQAQKDKKDDERLAAPLASNGDLASSPSSTVGPYSTNTPHPNQYSPDTSPDEETFRDAMANRHRPILEKALPAPYGTEEHDKAFKWQEKIVREEARGPSPATPDAQLRLEDEQAIKQVRDGPAMSGLPHGNVLTQGAEEAVQDPLQAQECATQAPADLPEGTSVDAGRDDINKSASSRGPETVAKEPVSVDVDMHDAPVPDPSVKSPPPASPSVERLQENSERPAAPSRKESEVHAITSKETPRISPKSCVPANTVTQANLQSLDKDQELARKEPKKPRLSTVVFAKPPSKSSSKSLQLYSADYEALKGASHDENRDYLQGLFSFQAHQVPRSRPLTYLLDDSSKTLTTANSYACLREFQDYKLLKRVYQLQNANRWSFRQLEKSIEPPRPVTHLDHLLAEMKWLRTDFKEERKWKLATAKVMAQWCAAWVAAGPEEKVALQVKVRRRPSQRGHNGEDDMMTDAPTPDLIPNETESEGFTEDDEPVHSSALYQPATLFTLGYDDVVAKMHHTPASDTLLSELPSYEPSVKLYTGHDDPSISTIDPPVLPISKFVTGKLVSKVTGPPRKRSRYEYEEEEDYITPPHSRHNSSNSIPSTPGRRFKDELEPEQKDVALFNPENKHVRDRLHAGHAFRPPSEFNMPTTAFFESRQSSQWLWEEDQKLRQLVKEYSFNWSLISSSLSQPSLFTSGAERRTPWECFERWMHLEGLPAEMSKTQYFRTYQSRLEAAQKTVTAQHQAAAQQLQQQQQANGQPVTTPRVRRTAQPIRVERRRNNRYLALIDAMRKLARKRESAAHKAQETAKAAALRKAQETNAPKSNMHTPQEFSRLRYERELKIQEKQELYRQQLLARQQQSVMQQRPGQPGSIPGGPTGPVPQMRGGALNGSHVPSPLSNSSVPGAHGPQGVNPQGRPMPAQPGMQGNMPNGAMAGLPIGVQGMPQAQMQVNMQGQARMVPPNEAMRVAMARQHQQQWQQQQRAQMGQQANMNGMPNPSVMAAMAAANPGNAGAGLGAANLAGVAGNSASPRMMTPQMANGHPGHSLSPNNGGNGGPSQAQQLSSGLVPVISQAMSKIRAAYPDWPEERVKQAAVASLQNSVNSVSHQQQFDPQQRGRARVDAMNAAAGGAASGPLPGLPQQGNMFAAQQQHGGPGQMQQQNHNHRAGASPSPGPNGVMHQQHFQAQQAAAMRQQLMQQQQQQMHAQSQQRASPSNQHVPGRASPSLGMPNPNGTPRPGSAQAGGASRQGTPQGMQQQPGQQQQQQGGAAGSPIMQHQAQQQQQQQQQRP